MKTLNFFNHHEVGYGVNAHNVEDDCIPETMDAKPTPRTDYLDVIQQDNAATLVFSGHEHQYARMNINASGGLYELKTGTCGAPIVPRYDANTNSDKLVKGPVYAYHYAVVDIDGEQVTFDVRALPSLQNAFPNGLPDGGATFTVHLSPPITARSVMFFVDDSSPMAGLAEIGITNSSDIDITKDATLTCSAETSGTCVNARDNSTTYNNSWKTPFVNTNTWIKLEWTTPQSIRSIKLNDVPSGASYIHVKGGTLIIEDANGIPIVGTIVKSDNYNATLTTGTIDDYIYNYSTQSGIPPISLDNDQDGILNTVEGSGDADGDGILDFQDSDSGVARLASGVGKVAIDVNENQIPGVALNAVDTILDTDSSLDQQNKPNLSFPYGLTGLNIQNVAPGETVEVTLTFPSNIPMDYQYWKYDVIRGWYNLNDLNRVGDNDGDNILTITLTDGGIGDGDGVADGTIRDLGGLGAPKPQIVNDLVTFSRLRSSYRTSTDTDGCTIDEVELTKVYVGQFSFDATLRNKGNSAFSLSGLMAEVIELTNGNVLQNANGVPGGVGARLTIPDVGKYADGVLRPGESVNVHFIICLTDNNPFRFVVNVLGFKNAISAQSLPVPESKDAKPVRKKLHKRGFFGRFSPQ